MVPKVGPAVGVAVPRRAEVQGRATGERQEAPAVLGLKAAGAQAVQAHKAAAVAVAAVMAAAAAVLTAEAAAAMADTEAVAAQVAVEAPAAAATEAAGATEAAADMVQVMAGTGAKGGTFHVLQVKPYACARMSVSLRAARSY